VGEGLQDRFSWRTGQSRKPRDNHVSGLRTPSAGRHCKVERRAHGGNNVHHGQYNSQRRKTAHLKKMCRFGSCRKITLVTQNRASVVCPTEKGVDEVFKFWQSSPNKPFIVYRVRYGPCE
jgi:hypothetical protein